MAWLKLAWLAFARFFAELDRHRAQAKQIRREDRLNEIKNNSLDAHSDRFGNSSGRVSVNKRDTK